VRLRSGVLVAVLVIAQVTICRAEDQYEFWRNELRRHGVAPAPQSAPITPPTSLLPTYPPKLSDVIAAPQQAMLNCFIQEMKKAAGLKMTPTDFSRVADGICFRELQGLTNAAAQWAAQVSPVNVPNARAMAQRIFAEARTQAVSVYTSTWYEVSRNTSAPPPASQPQPRVSSGSGFYISPKILVTNDHVVNNCSAILVGGKHPAVVASVDPTDDLAVVSVPDGPTDVATLRVRPPARTGESVVAFGFPLLDMLSSNGNATTGIVTSDAGLLNDSRHMQISAPIQPGNSGGPVLDRRGDVVGIVDSTIKPSVVQGGVPQNINFAIKTGVVALFLDAHNIAYNASVDEKELAVPDIVERAKKYTVPIICYEGTSTQNVQVASKERAPTLDPSVGDLQRKTETFLKSLYRAVSSPNSETLAFLSDVYAPSPMYFKETLSRQEVLAKVTRFIERWPQRKYQINSGSVSVHCNDKERTCEAHGGLTFEAISPDRRERSSGQATFDYTLQFSDNSSSP